MNEAVVVESTDFWVKVVAMLQQNWALIGKQETGEARVYFINDASGVFDEITFPSESIASEALDRNGFRRFAVSANLQTFLNPPSVPFRRAAHPNGAIYSSGRFWH